MIFRQLRARGDGIITGVVQSEAENFSHDKSLAQAVM
jgi:hypothetical protein